ncbi:MAG TPA: DUF1080 domain-containing protein [Phycisphaerae bacterium]|nr:DUF1080 domain-containing protein [Phycisphaerae bacterium]
MRKSLLLALPLLAAAPLLLAQTPATQPSAASPVPPITGKLGTPIDLFNGKDFSGWSWHATDGSKLEDVWTIKDGAMHCAKGKKGYIGLDKDYTNFKLIIEQRHITQGNGGFFVCIHGDPKVWPDGIQIQGKWGAVCDLINQNSGMKMDTDPARTKKQNQDYLITRIGPNNEKPLGEWNTIETTVDHGNLTTTLNGQLQNWATHIDPATGKIGIQDEGAEMEFRKVQLIPIE